MGRLSQFFSPLVQLQQDLTSIFDEPSGDPAAAVPAPFPPLNAWETADAAYVEAELPGMAMQDIDVSATGRELTIGGTRKTDSPANAECHRRERAAGSFSRTVSLPWEVDPAKIEARLRDGVLTVTLPKAEGSKARKITVQAV